MSKILTITTGGTIFQKEVSGKMEISLSAQELIEQTDFPGAVEFFAAGKTPGAEMIFETLISIKEKIITEIDNYDGIVLITGTDSMEEVAFSLDLLLDVAKPVVVTGAMKPSDITGYDGIANYSGALKIAASPQSNNKGVLVYLNDSIHLARYVHKDDSALIGSFRSHPGPIGETRCNEVIYYYDTITRTKTYNNLDHERLYSIKVPIWTMTVSPHLPEAYLEGIDGLVIAGMGTGSIASHLIDYLSERWTRRIPIVLSSRCRVGLSYDDFYYKGSREKYESKGFKLYEYRECNPLQARLKLCFDICTYQE
jgi:L-asparaginase